MMKMHTGFLYVLHGKLNILMQKKKNIIYKTMTNAKVFFGTLLNFKGGS